MKATDSDGFARACSQLVGQIAVNPPLAAAIAEALASGKLTPNSGPKGIENALKGHVSIRYNLKEFLKAWGAFASHLDAADVTTTVKSALACYRLAERRVHMVNPVWTGPPVPGSEVRRTEPVVSEILAGADKELLIVGYWLVASTVQIRTLIKLLIAKARAGVNVRFVFDPSEKFVGVDNFGALNGLWPQGLRKEVYTWSDALAKATTKGGIKYDRKLHAKVIVADGHDALVTSANLTGAGFLQNLEMGLRINGPMAGATVRHFDLLIEAGILEVR